MKLYTGKISTKKAKSFEDLIADFQKKDQVKTASTKIAEQEEAESSGQLDVEPLHQEGESTTMPKQGPSAKKDDSQGSKSPKKDSDKEGESSGQPEAEAKLVNVPEDKESKKASKEGQDYDEEEGEVPGEQDTGPNEYAPVGGEKDDDKDDKDLTKEQEEKLPEKLKEQIKNKKEAGKEEAGKRDGTGPYKDSFQNKTKEEGKRKEKGEECPEDKESSSKQFVKIANLDEKNKTFLKKFWGQLFGDDYVNALIADK